MKSALAAVLLLTLVGVACGDDSESSSGDAVPVVATDDSCEPAETQFEAGKTTFEVKNEGDKVTELYVYAEGDRVISEVENVGPGTSRDLTVDLKAGDYELACKPGMTGKGIRQAITVTGEGGSQGGEEAEAEREVEVVATDFAFSGLDGFTAKPGETVEFYLENTGQEVHELEFLDANGSAIGEVEEIEAGKTGEAHITFAKAGKYTYICDVDDHASKGMKGTVTVS